ncbi:MAG: HAMP domain-containing protein [Acidobacteria bacterium]|nr:MAG: HAMP domain-containing protein [Acidobacteriota bacterium]REJ97990.1 MAG: HAMP domain-containing protein [Acidobacteriota bacterium]REK16733.1 MAG: HAMP domain-containing protein [Acidobacteriota bacterium]REK42644.1 MAG: HAMP domain-containing protein [Acidobacteriota bacterium]
MLPLILAPFLLTAFAAYYFLIRGEAIEVREAKDRRATEAIAELRKELRDARKDLALLKGVPAVIDLLEEVESDQKESLARTAMKLFFEQNPYYLELGLVGKDGRELISYSRITENAERRSVAHEDYFRRTLISGAFQSPVRELTDGKKVTILTDRIVTDRFLGIVVLSLNAESFERRLRPLLAGQGLSSFLFDDSGLVFAQSLETVEHEECAASLDLAQSTSGLLDEASEEVLRMTPQGACTGFGLSIFPAEAFQRTVYEPQAGENWFVGVLDREVTPAPTLAFQAFFVVALIAACFAVLYAATRFAARITVPLEKFGSATRQIARGDLDIDLEVSTGDEVEELAKTYRKMTADLRDYQERLIRSAKLAAIGELTSEISHEIQNRISGISLWVQYLDSELEKEDPRREYLEEIKLGMEGFLEMLANLKQYYRTPKLRRGEVDVNELVRGALPYAETEAAAKNVAVKVEESEGSPKVLGDPELLRSVLINLLLNAVEAVDIGGNITIRSSNGDQHAVIAVADDGAGIPEKDRSRIFYPFYSTRSGGSGLGLAIASNIVAAHGGSIGLESSEGSGSEFTLTLPVYHSSGGQKSNNGTYE